MEGVCTTGGCEGSRSEENAGQKKTALISKSLAKHHHNYRTKRNMWSMVEAMIKCVIEMTLQGLAVS